MTLAISGGSGFTCGHVLAAAKDAGIAATALRSDITDREALLRELREIAPTRFLHLAGISFVGHSDPRAFYEVNVLGSLNVLDALAALPRAPRSIVLASSAIVYGNSAQSPIDEDAPTRPAGHYAISKLAMEQVAHDFAGRLPVVIARPFNYTGPGQSTSFLVPKLVSHFQRREPHIELGDLQVEREFNDVRFVSEAYLRLLDKGVPGEVYNLCTGHAFALMQVIETLERLTGHTLEVDVAPALLRANEVRRLCGDPAKLFATVGPLPQPSLQQTLAWMLGTS